MGRSSFHRWGIPTLAAVFFAPGCAHVAPGTGAVSADVRSYYPLGVGNGWTYATTFQGQPQADLSVSIVREEGGFFVDDRPAPSRLRWDGDGLRDGDVRYLLKAPLVVGTQWLSVADIKTVERYEIVAVGQEVRVPAGVFRDCVTVRMEVRISDTQAMENHMTFAPGVGIVQIRTDLRSGARILPQSMLQLKDYRIQAK
jgi:hypothetical protein